MIQTNAGDDSGRTRLRQIDGTARNNKVFMRNKPGFTTSNCSGRHRCLCENRLSFCSPFQALLWMEREEAQLAFNFFVRFGFCQLH